ncbi:hypothetical protein HXX76_010080 [Chlamydomonas incerta]|uniref:Cyclic nucleotide-binding domain-containing protein n=1 Tax=Chlamydomonas incerta TaxID=51695 RepID=A0A835SRN1_CHLIN|nr:hypothetical protein HXX76_010080 [Chlamydomonas incerta]|eukprot:KAG2430561.1 hypothetical protein HXX76_010080 [Chlamydomonas incerta]
MAASVAFLHQAEYEATLQEYEDEAAHRHQEEDQDLTRTASDAALRAIRAGGAEGIARAAHDRQAQLRRNVLKGQAKARDKTSAVANWLSATGPGAGAVAGPAGAIVSPGTGRKRRAVSNAGLGRSPSLRRSYSTIAKPNLWHRTVHADWRGITDSVLPIINPDTRAKRIWDLIVMSMVVWTAVTVPLSVSFGMPHTTPWDVADYMMTVLFGIDLLVNFRTAFYNVQGELVRDSGAIAANYMKMWFWIDLVGTIPFDSLVIGVGLVDPNNSSDNSAMAALGFLKAPRMLRLGRLLRFLDGFKNAKVFRIVQLFLAMILISHWLACIWYMMYRFGGKDNAEDWAFNMATQHEDSVITSYVASYYYSFLLLVGDNINAYNNYERTFYVLVLIAGTFFYSAVVGQMATLVATMNVAVNRHAQKLLMVQDALRYAGVPDQYNEKVQGYFEYLQARSHPGGEGMAFLGELPSSLHLRLCEFLHSRSLKKVPLFADCEEGFLSALALRMRMISLSPKEVIFRVGDAGKEMYVIKKGCVAVTSPTHQMWSLLVAGEVFGEVALLSTGKRTANCTALGFVDLALLTGPDLQAVMRDYPVSAAIIAQRAAERARSLQTKNKMWLEVSDDEDDDPDAWHGDDPDAEDLAAADDDSIGSAAPPEDDADGDAAAGSSDGDAGSSHSAKEDEGEGSGGGGSDPGVAAKVKAGGGGTPKKAAELSGRSSPEEDPPPAAAAAVRPGSGRPGSGRPGSGRPGSGRPVSARNGRLVAEAWSHGAGEAEEPPRGAGERAARRTDSQRRSDDAAAAAPPPVPRLSLELVRQGPAQAGRPQQEPGQGQGQAEQAAPPPVPPAAGGGDSGAVPDSPAAAPASLQPPGSTLKSTSMGRRMSMRRRGSAEALMEGDEFAAAAAAAVAMMRSAAPPQQQTLLRQATNNRRQSMAFWLNEESSQGALAALAASGASFTGAAAAAAATAGASDGFTPKQDGDEIVWFAPRAGKRRSSDASGAADYAAAAAAASGGLNSSRGPYQAARMQAAAAAQQQQQQQQPPPQQQPQAAAAMPAVPAAASAQLLHMSSSNLTYESPAASHRDGRGGGGAAGAAAAAAASPAALAAAAAAAAGGRPSTVPTRMPATGLGTATRIVARRGGSKEYSPSGQPLGAGHSAAAAAAAAAVAAAINGDPNWEQAAAEAVAASAAAAKQGAWGPAALESPGAAPAVPPPAAPLPPAPPPPPPLLLAARLRVRGGAGPVAEAAEGEEAQSQAQAQPPHPASPFATSALSPANLIKALGGLSPLRTNRHGSIDNLIGSPGALSPMPARNSTGDGDDGGAAPAGASAGGPSSPLPSGIGAAGAPPMPSAAFLKLHRRGSGGCPVPDAPLRSPGARRAPRLSTSSPEPSRHAGGGGGGGDDGGGGAAAVQEEDLGPLGGPGRGDEPEWISTRTGMGLARQTTRSSQLRHGHSSEILNQDDLARLAPAGSSGGGGGGGGGGGARGRHGGGGGLVSPLPASQAAALSAAAAAVAAPLHGRVSATGLASQGGTASGMHVMGTARSRRSSTETLGANPYGQRVLGTSMSLGPARNSRRSSSGMPGRGGSYGAPPPPPPPDGVFVPRESWNTLLQAVSKLGHFEAVLQQLLDLVSQQDDAMERLETKAERAAAMAKAGNGADFSVLGIVADHPALKAGGGGGGGANGGAAGGAAGAAGAGAAAAGGAGAGSAALARSGGGATGSVSGSGAAGSSSGRGAASRRSSATALAAGSAAAIAAAAAAAIGADGEASQSGPSLSARSRLQGTVRAIGNASRLRNMLTRGGGGGASGNNSGNNSGVFRGVLPLPPGTMEILEDGAAEPVFGNNSGGGGVPGDGGGGGGGSGSIRLRSSTGPGGGGDGSPGGGSMRSMLAAGLQRPRRSSLLSAAAGPTPGLKSALKGSAGAGGGGGFPSGTYMGSLGSPLGTARSGSPEPTSRQGTGLGGTPRGPDR